MTWEEQTDEQGRLRNEWGDAGNEQGKPGNERGGASPGPYGRSPERGEPRTGLGDVGHE